MRTIAALAIIAVLGATGAPAQPLTPDEQRQLRTQIEERYDVVPLTDGLALRPKARMPDVRLIEIADAIAINGVPVTGRELRERVGDAADAILRLSYLDAEARQALFAEAPVTAPEPVEAVPPVEAPSAPDPPRPPRRSRRSSGDRVRVFGDVSVGENEEVGGQVVAVIGSVRIDGAVSDQVVAVLGSVTLGPKAVVGGDVVSVGGRVRRAEGAQVRGDVTEVAFADPDIRIHVAPWWVGDWGWHAGEMFGGMSRLIGTGFRLLLFALLACIALVVARGAVEGSAERVSDNPVKATFIGLASMVLIGPVLLLTAIVLAISIIGIPLLLLLPFAVLLLVLMAVAGFSGTAFAVGQWTRRRFGIGAQPAFVDVCLGVFVILLPLLVARLLGLAGWPVTPIAFVLLFLGFTLECLAWTAGFGAVLTNAFTRWQARRTIRTPVPPPANP